jgi:biopolymer transport protein ExbB/TolQ
MNGQVDWIRVAEFAFLIIGFAFAVWKAWVAMTHKVNAFGVRVAKLETGCVEFNTRQSSMEREQERARDERASINAIATQALTKIDAMREEIADERLAIQSTLHANEKAAADRDSALREKLARLEERLNIRAIVSQTVKEFKEKE